MTSDAKIRIVALLFYLLILIGVQYWCIGSGFTPNENAIWFYSGILSLLFGSRLLNPYFTAPADSATNGVAGLLALLPAFPIVRSWTIDAYILDLITAYCALVAGISIVVIILRRGPGLDQERFWLALDRAVKGLGSPTVIFTALIIASAWLFHRDKPVEVFAILATLTVVVIIKPIEAVVSYFGWIIGLPAPVRREDVVGVIAAYQSPGIVLIRQLEAKQIARGTPMVISDRHGPLLLGVALNYVGRDEGNLLRAVTDRLPSSLEGRVDVPVIGDEGLAVSITLNEDESSNIAILRRIERLCGIVDSDTSLEYMQFEVVDETGLTEACLTEARIGDQRSVIYQVIEGFTREDIVQQKNKYGYARAKARKVGAWDADGGKFTLVPWLPRINAPVFLLDKQQSAPDVRAIGHFPNTPYGVRIDMNSAVTHNTAVLGILGVGKSYLSIELVERMIAEGIKVLCLDLTNQYEILLADFLDKDHEAAKRAELITASHGGQPNQNRELGGSLNAFKKTVLAQITDFMSADDDHNLRVINPAQFRVTKQPSFLNRDGTAELMRMTACEITAIFSNVALMVCQDLGMTDKARLCLVYEEAHSLVPEWNSVASEGDRIATATSARAILQGRKYGLGCLLITQRTANVTKTILNQCNTIFAMRTFDDTGKEFLGNYIGSDYAGVLPSLQPRQAVVFGKASSCENPVLVRLNDRDQFVESFRQDHPPVAPVPYHPPVAVAEVAGNDDNAVAEGEGQEVTDGGVGQG